MKIAFTIVNLLFIATAYFGFVWFDKSIYNLEKGNEKYIRNIRKAKKIQKIDRWLRESVSLNLKKIPTNSDDAEASLINFFDKHSKEFNFRVKRFIYSDKMAKHLDVEFKLQRDDKERLSKFLHLKYSGGYIVIKNFDVKKDIAGYLDIVQPMANSKKKLIKRVDNVPQ